MGSNLLHEVAEVLEKAAAYIEHEETARTEKEAAMRLSQANTLAEKVSEATGTILTDHLVEKLSKADPDVQGLIQTITDPDTVESLGGPENSTKLASVHAETGSAEQGLLDFLST